ncbi:hypothetical protein V1525DRAFT_405621 [Lipomyces kononenkoae]|uniref:Uncharacterized protein n=1 Tax=Lipomyces kononenkoae TaxID=34357 RepID=A0ACC3SZ17_LIPKO
MQPLISIFLEISYITMPYLMLAQLPAQQTILIQHLLSSFCNSVLTIVIFQVLAQTTLSYFHRYSCAIMQES